MTAGGQLERKGKNLEEASPGEVALYTVAAKSGHSQRLLYTVYGHLRFLGMDRSGTPCIKPTASCQQKYPLNFIFLHNVVCYYYQ